MAAHQINPAAIIYENMIQHPVGNRITDGGPRKSTNNSHIWFYTASQISVFVSGIRSYGSMSSKIQKKVEPEMIVGDSLVCTSLDNDDRRLQIRCYQSGRTSSCRNRLERGWPKSTTITVLAVTCRLYRLQSTWRLVVWRRRMITWPRVWKRRSKWYCWMNEGCNILNMIHPTA